MDFNIAKKLANVTATSLAETVEISRIMDSVKKPDRSIEVNGSNILDSITKAEPIAVSFENSKFGLAKRRALREKEVSDFIQENRDLIAIIDQSETAKKTLLKKKIETRNDLKDVIGEAAYDDLSSEAKQQINQDYLKKNTQISSMILLDVADLKKRINDNQDDAKNYFNDYSGAGEDILLDELAKTAANQFNEGHALHDESFFKDNPGAAIYVLTEKNYYKKLTDRTNGEAEASRFKARIDHEGIQEALEIQAAKFADQAVSSGAYSESFFKQFPRYAEFVGAGEFNDNRPTPAQYLKDNPQFMFDNDYLNHRFVFTDIIKSTTANQAKTQIGYDVSITSDFLTQSGSLAQFILKDERFVSSVKESNNAKKIKEIFTGETDHEVSDSLISQIKDQFAYKFDVLPKIYDLLPDTPSS